MRNTPQKTVELFKPFDKQKMILDDTHRFKVLACGRRFSKSTIGKIAITELALKGQDEVYWIAPTFKTSTNVWMDLKETFKNVTESKSEAERRLELTGGGRLMVWSAQNFDSIRGNKPKAVILDEAAMMNPEVWTAVVRPALSDKKGFAYFLSTPRGRNFFYDLFQMGLSEESKYKNYISWRFPSWHNPYVPKSEFIEAKSTLHQKIFAQEYLAEFLLDAADVFHGVGEVCTLEYNSPYEGHFVFGVDVGRQNDPTVITIWDKEKKHLVDMVRVHKTRFPDQKEIIEKTYEAWNKVGTVSRIMIESNYAPAFVESLMETSMPVRPFRTTNETKSNIVNRLATEVQHKRVQMLNDKDLLFEFQAFTMGMTPSGKPQYSAPAGYHDDIVMSACIGFEGCRTNQIDVGYLPQHIFGR